MRILFVSASPLKKEISIGNTFLNLFEDMKDVELASVCTRKGIPDPRISKCFCITEKMIVKNLLKKTPVGAVVDTSQQENVQKSDRAVSFAKRYRWTVFFWLQDLIWKIGRWRSPELEKFVCEFDPDIVFTVLSNSVFLNNLILHLVKLSGKKLVLYAWDNNYSLKQFDLSPLRWIKRFIDRASMRRVVKKADLFYVISNVQKNDYEKAFKKECKVLTKTADFSKEAPVKAVYNSPLQLVFTGNIGMNRWISLAHIANVLKRINKDEVKAQLRVYTGNPLTKKMEKALNIKGTSFVMGSVSADEVLKIQHDADMLVHVEAHDLKNKLSVRQSFSTKIVDYLAAARPIMAFGPKEVASIQHLVQNDCALVAETEEELYGKLANILSDTDELDRFSKQAYDCGKAKHDKSRIDTMLRDDIEGVLKL